MSDNTPLHGNSLYAIQQAQARREQDMKKSERETALEVLDRYAERHEWSAEDVEIVRLSLGLGGRKE